MIPTTQHEHTPPVHQVMDDWSPECFFRWAAEIGPPITTLVANALDGRRHPQQAYRTCLGILSLAKCYDLNRLEAACQRALVAGIDSYKGLHNILKNKLDQLERDQPPATPGAQSRRAR